MISFFNSTLFIHLLLPTFFIHLTRGLLSTTLPYYVLTYLKLSTTEVGIAVGAIGLGKMLSDIPAGILLDYIGARNLMILSGCVISASSILLLLPSSYALLVIAMFLIGAGEGMGIVSRLSQVTDDIPVSERGRISALLGASARIAMALGPLLSVLLTSISSSVLSVFFLQALLALVSVTVVVLHSSEVPFVKRPHKCGFRSTLTRPMVKTLLIISLFVFALQIVRECRKLVIPIAGVEAGYNLENLSIFTTVSFTIDALLFSAAGFVMDELGRTFAGVISISLLVLSLVVVVPGTTLTALAVHAIISGVGNGLSSGLVVAFGADLAPPGDPRSEFLGYFRLFADAGEFVGPLAVGLIAQYTSTPTMLNIISAMGLFGMVWLINFGPQEEPIPSSFDRAATVVGNDDHASESVSNTPEHNLLEFNRGKE